VKDKENKINKKRGKKEKKKGDEKIEGGVFISFKMKKKQKQKRANDALTIYKLFGVAKRK
jgi:hypothetical protein